MEKKTILIIEDDQSLRKVLKAKCEREGFGVFEASNGEEGLASALSHHPDCILLDIIMPKKDGISTLRELREDSWGEKASVIMLSNLEDAKTIERAVANKAFDYLIKVDWSLEEVIDKIKEKINKKKV